MMTTDQSDDRDLSLLAWAILAEIEGESVECDGEWDGEAAATVWLLAQAGVTLPDSIAYMRGERRES